MDEFGKDEEPMVNGKDSEKKRSKTTEEVGRRDFMIEAGKVGLSAGLASFLLVGGTMRDAVAGTNSDNCVSPYNETSGHDQCLSAANDDQCVQTTNNGVQGDRCDYPGPPGTTFDADVCSTHGDVDDACTITPQWNDDVTYIP